MTIYHPHKNDKGQLVKINHPSQASDLSNWRDPGKIATVVPGGPMPESICGIALRPWMEIPTRATDWERLVGAADFDERAFAGTKAPASRPDKVLKLLTW